MALGLTQDLLKLGVKNALVALVHRVEDGFFLLDFM